MSGTDKNIAILGRVGANIRERQSQHGDAVKTHRVIAQLWSAYLEIEVTDTDTAVLLNLMKIARISQGSGIDIHTNATRYMKYDVRLRPDRLYHAGIAAEVLSIPTEVLAKWRKAGIGPKWTVMPNDFVRYYGKELLSYTTPEGLGADPRDLFMLEAAQ